MSRRGRLREALSASQTNHPQAHRQAEAQGGDILKRPLGYKPRQVQKRSRSEASLSEEFRAVVFHRAEGRSQITGATEYPMDAHHAIPKSLLKRVAPDLIWDPDNGILLTRLEHTRHENRGTVISFEQLPDYVVRFAEIHDLTWQLEQAHPRRAKSEAA
jgi:hypothetical protein